jgi:hypothetical protein
MRNLGASTWIKGSASKGGVTKTFDWAFTHAVSHEGCRTTVGGRQVLGVDVGADAVAEVAIVFRARTLFEDGIGTLKPSLRFDPIADADTNGDGVIASNELSALTLAAVRTKYGFYATGGYGALTTLRDYLDAQSQRLPAFQGAGSCNPRRL